MIDRDDYGEPLPRKECAACRRGWHHECFGCGCPCNWDDDDAQLEDDAA